MEHGTTRRRLLSLMIAGSLALAAPRAAHAGVQMFPAAHIAFNVPNDWVTSARGQQVVTQPATSGVVIEFDAVTSAAEVQAGDASITRMLTRTFQNVTPSAAPQPIQQNGLRGVMRRGTATRNGVQIFWFACILGHPGGGVFAVGIANQAGLQTYQPLIVAVLNSIRAA